MFHTKTYFFKEGKWCKGLIQEIGPIFNRFPETNIHTKNTGDITC